MQAPARDCRPALTILDLPRYSRDRSVRAVQPVCLHRRLERPSAVLRKRRGSSGGAKPGLFCAWTRFLAMMGEIVMQIGHADLRWKLLDGRSQLRVIGVEHEYR